MFSYFNDASLIKTRNQHKCQKNGLRTNLKVKLVVYFLLLTCATANVVNGDGWNISSGYYSKQVVLNLDTEWKCGEVEINRAMVGGTDIIQVRIDNEDATSGLDENNYSFAAGWKLVDNVWNLTLPNEGLVKEITSSVQAKPVYLQYTFDPLEDRKVLLICRESIVESLSKFLVTIKRKNYPNMASDSDLDLFQPILSVLKLILSVAIFVQDPNTCLEECSGRGTCQNNMCICNPNFFGNACQLGKHLLTIDQILTPNQRALKSPPKNSIWQW